MLTWRAAMLALVVAVAAADAAGHHAAAFALLLLAVPIGAVAGLKEFAAVVDGEEAGAPLHALLAALVLALVVVSAAARAPVHAHASVPPVGVSGLLGALVLAGIQGLLAAGGELRRRLARPRDAAPPLPVR